MNERIALIIANSEYDDARLSRLKTPVNDAQALTDVLGDPAIGNFGVTLLINKTEEIVRREIVKLYNHRGRNDLLLLYYSGHGILDEYGNLYLASRDTTVNLAATAPSATFVREQIDKSGSQRKVVILDCCNSGAFAGTKAALGGSVGTQRIFAGNGYGRVILTASDALEYAWEGDQWFGKKKLSVFTHFIVEGLRTGDADLNRDGEISLDELYDYVYEQVLTSGYANQTPHKWAQKVQGQITIAHTPIKAEEPAPSPAPELSSVPTPMPSFEPASMPQPAPTPKTIQKTLTIFREHKGILRTADALRLDIHPRTLYAMHEAGLIERLERGLYRLAEMPPLANPDLVTVALKVPYGVICLVSALAFHGLTTEIPHAVDIALQKGSNRPRLAYPPVRIFWFSGAAWQKGTETYLIDGISVRITEPAKSIADIFKYRNKIGMDVALEALKLYCQHSEFDVNRLLHYARTCRVEKILRPYLEAIL